MPAHGKYCTLEHLGMCSLCCTLLHLPQYPLHADRLCNAPEQNVAEILKPPEIMHVVKYRRWRKEPWIILYIYIYMFNFSMCSAAFPIRKYFFQPPIRIHGSLIQIAEPISGYFWIIKIFLKQRYSYLLWEFSYRFWIDACLEFNFDKQKHFKTVDRILVKKLNIKNNYLSFCNTELLDTSSSLADQMVRIRMRILTYELRIREAN